MAGREACLRPRGSDCWDKYFNDPSQWWDCKTSSLRCPHLKFTKTSQESLWIDGWYNNPPSLLEELGHKGLLKSDDVHDGLRHIVALLKACAKQKDLCKGTRLHSDILRRGLLGTSLSLANTLVSMYAKCGVLLKAQQVLDELPARDVVTWNALISGYAQHGCGDEALNSFEQMQHEGLCPDAVTFICILKACAIVGAATKGKQIHDQIVRQGLLGTNIMLGNALVDMYAKCGELSRAQEVLDELLDRNVVTWSSLIAGYTQHGYGEKALNCFEQMQREGICPDAVAFISILKACAIVGRAQKGKQIHDQIVRQGLLGTDIVLATALVDMYAKCDDLPKAHQVLDELPIRDVVSWNALIAGYAQGGYGGEALNCFKQMQREGLHPNAVTFLCVLKACAILGAASKGKQIHDQLVRQGLLGANIVLVTALVDMYAKCGELSKAKQVLDELLDRNVVPWNALIAGYAQHENAEEAFNCFKQMQHEALCPDAVTIICVLSACSHSGLMDEAQKYFESIRTTYGITPDLEHYTCMVDLFGRSGHLEKAVGVLEKMPSPDYIPVWAVLLGACRKSGHVKLGKLVFEHAVKVDKPDAAAYVCVSDIYTLLACKSMQNKN